MDSNHSRRFTLVAGAALAFAFCWGSGYLAARFIRGSIEPINLLFVRYCITLVLLAGYIRYRYGNGWLFYIRKNSNGRQFTLGILYHVIYIVSVFYAVKLGLSAGITAAILSTQPIVTVALYAIYSLRAPDIRTTLSTVICLVGSLMLIDWMETAGSTTYASGLMIAVAAVAAVSIATLLHKRWTGAMDAIPALLVQLFWATVCTGVLLLAGIEHFEVSVTPSFIGSLLFLVLVTTIGSYSLMAWLMNRVSVRAYAFTLYLVSPIVMFVEYAAFGEQLSFPQVLGIVLVILGIAWNGNNSVTST